MVTLVVTMVKLVVTMVKLGVTMVTLGVTMVTLILSVPGVSTATEHHTRNSSAWTQL